MVKNRSKNIDPFHVNFANTATMKAALAIQDSFLKSPFLEAIKSMQDMQQSITAPFLNFQESISKINKDLYNNPTLKIIERFQSSLSTPMLEATKALHDSLNKTISSPMIEAVKAIQQRFNNINIPDSKIRIENFTESLSVLASQVLNEQERIHHSFLEDKLEEIENISNYYNKDIFKSEMNEFEIKVIDQIHTSSPNIISFEGMLNILLTLFLFFYTQIKQGEFEENIDNKLNIIEKNQKVVIESQARIYDALINHYQKHADDSTYFVVKRATYLRLKPDNKSKVITTLYPNQKVKLEQSKGKRIYIVCFDYLDGKTYAGWVMKKYLQRLNK